MMRFLLLIFLLPLSVFAQKLHIKKRSPDAKTGSAFAASIADTSISLEKRERLIYKEIESGNIPQFYRQLAEIRDTANITGKETVIRYFVVPDFLAIGSNEDYFYCPMTASLAQKVADKLHCSLITSKISDKIYGSALVKMVPQPIPPSKEMTTVPVFIRHNQMSLEQRKTFAQPPGALTAGNQKDVVISDKMYKDGNLRVVIYGWHKPDGKAIQPLYNGHKPDWADYSHGIRLISRKVYVNGKRMNVEKVLQSPELNVLLSDEGPVRNTRYPVSD